MNDYQKRATLMRDTNWIKTIEFLKSFERDDKKIYTVTYREGQQRKNSNLGFHSVKYVSETESFVFCSYVEDFATGELTDKVRNSKTLNDTDIISHSVRDKISANDLKF